MFRRKFLQCLLLLLLIAPVLSAAAGISTTASIFTASDSTGPVTMTAAWEEETDSIKDFRLADIVVVVKMIQGPGFPTYRKVTITGDIIGAVGQNNEPFSGNRTVKIWLEKDNDEVWWEGELVFNNGAAAFDITLNYDGNVPANKQRDVYVEIDGQERIYPYASSSASSSVSGMDRLESLSPATGDDGAETGSEPGAESGELLLGAANLQDAVCGEAYAHQFIAGGGMEPYTFALSDGALPAGVALNGPWLEGTPAASGTFVFSVTVTDAAGGTDTGEFTLIVLEAADDTDGGDGGASGPDPESVTVEPPSGEGQPGPGANENGGDGNGDDDGDPADAGVSGTAGSGEQTGDQGVTTDET